MNNNSSGLSRTTLRCLTLALCSILTFGADDPPSENQVKAAFLLNFTKFTEWPANAFESPESPISICVYGGDPFGQALDRIVAGEVVNNRRVVVQRLKQPPRLRGCQILFMNLPPKEMGPFLNELEPGVLTVGQGESFIRLGGAIGFVLENRRVRFIINHAAAIRAGLKLSARLLSVAKTVEQ